MKLISILFLPFAFSSCGSTQHGLYDLENANRGRTNQNYFEDSALVFFVDYPNPFSDRSFLWFWCFKEGDVELAVRDAITDTLEAVYFFSKQDLPDYSISIRATDLSNFVTCTVRVNGRVKCSRQYARWTPLLDKQDRRTRYTVKQK